jgi:hypothetical protein
MQTPTRDNMLLDGIKYSRIGCTYEVDLLNYKVSAVECTERNTEQILLEEAVGRCM